MDLRVTARVRKIDEDSLLKEISDIETFNPEVVTFVWRTKYIRCAYIDTYWELGKDKTVITYKDGTIEIIKEDIDVFAKRLASERKKAKAEDDEEEYSVEEGIEIELESENEDDDEEQQF